MYDVPQELWFDVERRYKTIHPLLMAAQRCRPDGHFRQEV